MALTQDDIQELAEAFAEAGYTDKELDDKRRELLDMGGERITSWGDAGVNVSKQYEYTTVDALKVLRKAIQIRAGLSGGRRVSPTVYFG